MIDAQYVNSSQRILMNTSVSTQVRGTAAIRFAKCLAAAKGDPVSAVAIAQGWKYHDTAMALKEFMTGMDTDNTSALVAEVGYDYAEFLRPQTIIGRLTGMRRVPFKMRLLAQSSGTASFWVGQKKPKPVTRAEFEGTTMPMLKNASITVVTNEEVQFSAPSAEAVLSRDMGRAGAQAMDNAFIDPDNAGIADVMPASVTNGAPQFASTGPSVGNIDEDLERLINSLIDAGSDLTFATWVMRPQTAVYLSRLRGSSDGALAYPLINARGGFLMGLPVLTSANVPASTESGNPTSIVLVDAAQISIADDGDSEISVATKASIQMESEPGDGAAQLVSLWQLGLVGIRAERMVNWRRRHAGVTASLTGVTF